MLKENASVTGHPVTDALEKNDYEIERNKPMPSKNHSYIQLRLGAALLNAYEDRFNFLSELDLAPPGVKPSVPDICIYPKSPVDLLKDEVKVTEAPITTIEILSPKQGIEDVTSKIFEIYFPAGVQSAWLIIPPLRSVHIFTPDRNHTTFNTGALYDPATGISLALDSFFPK